MDGGGLGPSQRLGRFWATANGRRPSPSVLSSYINVSLGSGAAAEVTAALRAFNGTLTAILTTSYGSWTTESGSLLATTLQALLAQGVPLESAEASNEPDISAFSGNLTGYLQQSAQWASALAGAGLPPLLDIGVLAASSWYSNASDIVTAWGGAALRFCIHRYPLSQCTPRTTNATVPLLLAASTSWTGPSAITLQQEVQGTPSARTNRSLPITVGEGNSVSCGGTSNVSNTYANALYAVRATLDAAAANMSRYVWHGVSMEDVFYNIIQYNSTLLATPGSDEVQVTPIYYGIWAASQALIPGGVFLSPTIKPTPSTSGSLRAWVVHSRSGDGGWRLMAQNEGATAVEVAFTPPVPCSAGSSAAALRVLASAKEDPYSTEGISWGGQSLDSTVNGEPTPALPAETAVPCQSGVHTFTLAKFSSGLLRPPYTGTPSPSVSPTASAAATASATPSFTVTPSATASGRGQSPSVSPTLSPSTTATVSATLTPTLTPSGSPTSSPTPSFTPSATTSPTSTLSTGASPSVSPTPSPTPSPSPSEVASQSPTPTFSQSTSGTASASASPTPTTSANSSPTSTLSMGASPSVSPSAMPLPSPSPSPAALLFPSLTSTPTSTHSTSGTAIAASAAVAPTTSPSAALSAEAPPSSSLPPAGYNATSAQSSKDALFEVTWTAAGYVGYGVLVLIPLAYVCARWRKRQAPGARVAARGSHPSQARQAGSMQWRVNMLHPSISRSTHPAV